MDISPKLVHAKSFVRNIIVGRSRIFKNLRVLGHPNVPNNHRG
jgi:hypothetical protein